MRLYFEDDDVVIVSAGRDKRFGTGDDLVARGSMEDYSFFPPGEGGRG